MAGAEGSHSESSAPSRDPYRKTDLNAELPFARRGLGGALPIAIGAGICAILAPFVETALFDHASGRSTNWLAAVVLAGVVVCFLIATQFVAMSRGRAWPAPVLVALASIPYAMGGLVSIISWRASEADAALAWPLIPQTLSRLAVAMSVDSAAPLYGSFLSASVMVLAALACASNVLTIDPNRLKRRPGGRVIAASVMCTAMATVLVISVRLGFHRGFVCDWLAVLFPFAVCMLSAFATPALRAFTTNKHEASVAWRSFLAATVAFALAAILTDIASFDVSLRHGFSIVAENASQRDARYHALADIAIARDARTVLVVLDVLAVLAAGAPTLLLTIRGRSLAPFALLTPILFVATGAWCESAMRGWHYREAAAHMPNPAENQPRGVDLPAGALEGEFVYVSCGTWTLTRDAKTIPEGERGPCDLLMAKDVYADKSVKLGVLFGVMTSMRSWEQLVVIHGAPADPVAPASFNELGAFLMPRDAPHKVTLTTLQPEPSRADRVIIDVVGDSAVAAFYAAQDSGEPNLEYASPSPIPFADNDASKAARDVLVKQLRAKVGKAPFIFQMSETATMQDLVTALDVFAEPEKSVVLTIHADSPPPALTHD